MAPKVKFTKEEIVSAALRVAKRCGIQKVTARDVAAELKVSTRPIFTYFSTMEELREAVSQAATDYFTEYTQEGLKEPYPFRGYGMKIIHFAQEERELYRSMFMTAPVGAGKTLRETIFHLSDTVLESIMRTYRMNKEEAIYFYLAMILVGYGMACLNVSDCISYSDEETMRVFTDYSLSVGKAIKEIPGFINGTFDSEEAFRQMIGSRVRTEGMAQE